MFHTSGILRTGETFERSGAVFSRYAQQLERAFSPPAGEMPCPAQILFLTEYSRAAGEESLLPLAEKQLHRLAADRDSCHGQRGLLLFAAGELYRRTGCRETETAADCLAAELMAERQAPSDSALGGAWAMTVGGLTRAGRVFGRQRYLEAALRGEERLRAGMSKKGEFCRKQGESPAALGEYAWYAVALLELALSGCGAGYAAGAETLLNRAEELFAAPAGGYGGTLSDNGAMLWAQQMLQTQRPDWARRERGRRQAKWLMEVSARAPEPMALTALLRFP